MMLFLIEYDRDKGKIVTMRPFPDSDREKAENCRLQLEVDLNQKGLAHEVVLLQASSEEALRQTHRRYFADIAELARSTAGSDI
jgi:hypothetical protein